jgi:hypothetical protein
MEERKTAAIILSILAFIAIVFFIILPYINKKRTHTLSYSTCSVDFKYRYDVDTLDDFYFIAQNDLALCLCNAYLKKPVDTVARQILKIYKSYGTSISRDSVNNMRYNNLDSILKYKEKAFTRVLDD